MKRFALMFYIANSVGCCLLLSACGGGGGGSGEGSSELCSVAGGSEKILGGESCGAPGAVLRLLIDSGFDAASCSGILVSPIHFLTAAHCVTGDDLEALPASALTVSSGEATDILASVTSVAVMPSLEDEVTRILNVIGDSFDPSDPANDDRLVEVIFQSGLSDIAVVTLDHPLDRPTLPISVNLPPAVGDTLPVFGFGATSVPATEPSTTLKAGTIVVRGVAEKNLETHSSSSGSEVCKGDSGGPAIVETVTGPAVVGVLSVGSGMCDSTSHNLYALTTAADVRAFLETAAPDATFR